MKGGRGKWKDGKMERWIRTKGKRDKRSKWKDGKMDIGNNGNKGNKGAPYPICWTENGSS
jgi:hypothetical protein